jgi:molybdopterin synthase catalytic subunit
MVRLQAAPIVAQELIDAVRGDADGAVWLFLGTVRNHHAGRRVRWLEYQAYPEMARHEMLRIESEALARFAVRAVALVHRTGRLEVGETSVGVAVAAAHRAAAGDACRFVIDELKREVPIWKKEFFEGGAEWIEGPADQPSPSDSRRAPDSNSGSVT